MLTPVKPEGNLTEKELCNEETNHSSRGTGRR